MQDNIIKRLFPNRNRVENLSVFSYNKIKNSVHLNRMMEKGAPGEKRHLHEKDMIAWKRRLTHGYPDTLN